MLNVEKKQKAKSIKDVAFFYNNLYPICIRLSKTISNTSQCVNHHRVMGDIKLSYVYRVMEVIDTAAYTQ